MGLWLPDSRHIAPEFFYPNRKPTGNVRVNWEVLQKLGISHDDLVIYFASGNHKSLLGDDTLPFGGAAFGPTGAYRFTGASGEYVEAGSVAAYSSGTSVLAIIRFTYKGVNGPLFGKWDNDGNRDKFFVGINDGKIGIIFHNSTSYSGKRTVEPLVNGVTYTAAIRWNTGVFTIYLDGSNKTLEIWSGGTVTSMTSDTLGFFRIGSKEDATSSTTSDIDLIIASPHLVDDNALHALSDKPYLFLEPA